jgi:hypothetical protein
MVTLSSLSVFRAVAATATLPILAKLVRAIEVTINTSLDFGTLAVTEDKAGAATLDPATGNLTVSSEGGLNLAGGVPRAGKIQIRGAPMPVEMSLETNSLRITNGTDHLTVNNFNFLTAQGGPDVTVTPDGLHNTAIVALGATITTRPRQLTGTYIGTNTVFANYQ